MLERDLQQKCMDAAKSEGVLAVNFHGSGWSNKGFPDLLLFARGRCVAVELKNGSGYGATEAQKVWRNRFARCGIPWSVAESSEEFGEILKEAFDEDRT